MARPEQINRSRGACIFHAADNIIIVRLLLGYLGRWCGYCCAWIINVTGSNNAAALLANSTPDVALFACGRCNGLQRIRIWWTQILSGFKICSLTSISSYRELLDHNVFRMKECRRRLVTNHQFFFGFSTLNGILSQYIFSGCLFWRSVMDKLGVQDMTGADQRRYLRPDE